MRNKTVSLSIKTQVINRSTPGELSKSDRGWKNVSLSVDQLINHVTQGFPITHQFSGGNRSKENFLSSNLLIADIDHRMSIEEALGNEFIKSFATLIYTTPRHTHKDNRFRIVFVLDRLIFDPNSYEAMYAALMNIIPTDERAKSAAQFFFGSKSSEVTWIGKSLPESEINKMISSGMNQKAFDANPPTPEQLTAETLVKVKNRGLHPIQGLKPQTSIHCPFGTHQDKNPSAFVKTNKDGVLGIECRSCGQSAWVEPLSSQDQIFDVFDNLVRRYEGQHNGHFEFRGLTAYDHNLETSLAKSNFHITNTEHFKIREVTPGIHLIKSPKGSGKTEALIDLVSKFKDPKIRKEHGLGLIKNEQIQSQRTILIGHRQSLIHESATKLGLECYLDTTGYDTKIIRERTFDDKPKCEYSLKPQHYAICLDSLQSRIRPRYEQYGVVIIDESEQVFSHFLSTHMKHPTNNFEILAQIIKGAKFVYCLDADLGQITMTGIMSCLSYPNDPRHQALNSKDRHYQRLYCHLNAYRPPTRTLEVYSSKNQLIEELHQSIRHGKRCFVTSNSRKFIKGLYEVFSNAYESKKFQLVVSEEGDDLQIRHFLKNIKTEILGVDAVFCSPTIGTGVDITFPGNQKKVDVVYGIFESDITTHFDIDQQLARVRHPGTVKVWINPKRSLNSTDTKKIAQEFLMGDEIKGLRYYLDNQGGHASEGEHPFVDLISDVTSLKRRSMNNLKQNFLNHKVKTGWKIIEVESNESRAKTGSIINKAGKKSYKHAKVDRLMSAPDLSLQEVDRIRTLKESNQPLTDQQKASYEKYWIEQFYCQKIDQDLIIFDDDGKTRDRILLFEYLINSRLRHTDFNQIKQPELLVDSRLNIKEKQLKRVVFLREIFNHAGIYDLTSFQFIENATYSTNTLTNFIGFLSNKHERYLQLFEKSVNEHINERPVGQVGNLLKLIALDQTCVRENKGGNVGGSLYKINPETYRKLVNIVKNRISKIKSP